MVKKDSKIISTITTRNDDHEVVTKGFLRNEFKNEFKNELKTELKIELKNELIPELRELIKGDFQTYIDVVMEDNQHKHEQLIEAFQMQYEMFLRYTDGNEADKQKVNSRLDRLESKVLFA